MPKYRCLLSILLVTPMLLSGCASTPTPAPTVPAAAQNSVTVGETTLVAIAPAPQAAGSQQNLLQFLGLDVIGQGVCGAAQRGLSRIKTALNLEGRFPALQPKPPVLPITDPANLSETASPAVQAAAEVKAEQDAAPQKVQALRYLATIGCGGCYPGVEDALLSALDDCTEEVRYEAALALRGSPNPCRYCRSDACCSPKVRKKLNEIAYKMDDEGCYVEPSERVRRQARLALDACGGGSAIETLVPEEGPTLAPTVVSKAEQVKDTLFSEIQLVSFRDEIVVRQPNDIVLAEVNGAPIFDSQVAERVEEDLSRSAEQLAAQDLAELRRSLTRKHLDQLIHQKLVVQAVLAELNVNGAQPVAQLTQEDIEQWLDRRLEQTIEVTESDIRAFYASHTDQFRSPPFIRWEQVTAKIDRFASRESALNTITYVRQRAEGRRGQPKQDVKPELIESGVKDTTSTHHDSHGLLAASLSQLTVGQLSSVLEFDKAFHLIRVLERRPAIVVPYHQAADQIRRDMRNKRRHEMEQTLLVELRQEADVWTVFDEGRPHLGPVVAGIPRQDETERRAPSGNESVPKESGPTEPVTTEPVTTEPVTTEPVRDVPSTASRQPVAAPQQTAMRPAQAEPIETNNARSDAETQINDKIRRLAPPE